MPVFDLQKYNPLCWFLVINFTNVDLNPLSEGSFQTFEEDQVYLFPV